MIHELGAFAQAGVLAGGFLLLWLAGRGRPHPPQPQSQ